MKRKIRRYLNVKMRRREAGERPGVMKYIRQAVLACFVLGIISANFIEKGQFSGFGIWNTYFIEEFKLARIQPADLFYYILEQRLPIMILLLALAGANWGTAAGSIFLGWQSFAGGFMMAAAVISYGLKGVLLVGTALFPQYLLYIPLYVSYLYLGAFWKERSRSSQGSTKAGKMREYMLFTALCLLLLSVYVTGIFLESYVNPYLLKNILKFF